MMAIKLRLSGILFVKMYLLIKWCLIPFFNFLGWGLYCRASEIKLILLSPGSCLWPQSMNQPQHLSSMCFLYPRTINIERETQTWVDKYIDMTTIQHSKDWSYERLITTFSMIEEQDLAQLGNTHGSKLIAYVNIYSVVRSLYNDSTNASIKLIKRFFKANSNEKRL